MILHRSRLRKNGSEWFDKVSTNEKYSMLSNSDSAPFAPTKSERSVFQQPARYSFFRLAMLHLSGIFLLAVTLCVAFPFFLVVVSVGTASAGAYALGRRWDERRGRHYGARERERFSPRAKRTRDLNNSIAEESSVQFEIENQRAAIPTKDAKKNN
jgi:hypothetical protein